MTPPAEPDEGAVDRAAPRSRLPVAGLLALGGSVSVYLLLRTLTLLDGGGSIDVCSSVFGATCDETLRPEWFVFGLPLAGWGVAYFGALGALLAMGWGLGETFESEATVGALLLSLLGAAGSLLLGASMLAGPAPACPLCFAVHAVNLLLVPAIWRVGRLGAGRVAGAMRAGVRYVLGGKVADPAQAAWKAIGFGTCLLVGVVLYQWTLVEVAGRRGGGQLDPARLVADFEAAPVVDLPTDAGVPRLGPPDAAVRIVVFSSFECPGCRTLAPMLRGLHERFGGQVSVEFRHYPFGAACNAHTRSDRHPRSCDAAWAATAAAAQGRFWEYHDALFGADTALTEDGLATAARNAGLDLERFAADRAGDAAQARVRLDVDLGARLGVSETPAVFVAGRRVRDLSTLALEILVHHALSGSR